MQEIAKKLKTVVTDAMELVTLLKIVTMHLMKCLATIVAVLVI